MVTFSGQGVDKEDTSYWYSEPTSAASSIDSSDYNSDDGLVDIDDEDLKMPSFSVSLWHTLSIFTAKSKAIHEKFKQLRPLPLPLFKTKDNLLDARVATTSHCLEKTLVTYFKYSL